MVLEDKGIPASPPIGSNDIADALLCRRYLLRDRDGRIIETVEQMFWRVPRAAAAVELR